MTKIIYTLYSQRYSIMKSVHERFLKHFDDLISEGNELPETGYKDDVKLGARLVAWETRCLNIVEKAFGSDSDYYKRIERSFNVGNTNIQRIYGLEILKSAEKIIRICSLP
jgi:hypothetical protein